MAKPKLLFNHYEDERLVEMVAKFDFLYDLENPSYKNQGIKDNAWKEVAQEVQRSVEDCKKRWKNIKDTFQKRTKKICSGTSSSESNKPKPWALENMLLSFLPKVEYRRFRYFEYAKVDNDIDYTSQKSEEVQELPTKKIKLEHFLQIPNTPHQNQEELIDSIHNISSNDDVKLFFQSMAASVKKLHPSLVMEAKIKCMELLSDLQNRNK